MNNTIRNEFPYPIAKAYLRAVNADEPVERFTLIGYLFEVALKFIASVSIAEYVQSRRRDESVNKTLQGINRPSLGNWAGFLRDTLRFNLTQGTTLFSDRYFKKSPDYKKMIAAVNAINDYLNPDKPSNLTSVSPEMFVNAMVNYRNKTKGHGAIQKRDCVNMNPVLFDAVEEFMFTFPLFLDYELALVRKIEFDKRNNFVHQLEKLDGTDIMKTTYVSQQPDPNVRAGHIALCKPEEHQIRPFLSLHPLFIFLDDKEDVYVLNEGEGARIEYLCYHRGGRDAIYTPDELKEDFVAFFGDILAGKEDLFQEQREARPKSPEVSAAPPASRPQAERPRAVQATSEAQPRVSMPEKEVVVPAPPKAAKGFSFGIVIGVVAVVAIAVVGLYFLVLKKPVTPPQPAPIVQTEASSKPTQPAQPVESKKPAKPEAAPLAQPQPKGPQAKGEAETPEKPAQPPPAIYYTEREVDVPPSIIGGSNKVYDYIDMSSLHMGPTFRGTVEVRAYINENGGVDRTEVLRGIDPRFDGAAINAVHQLRFTPAELNGERVKSQTVIRILFQGKPEEQPAQPKKPREEEAIPPPP